MIRNGNSQFGFTLVEMAMVILILGLLVGAVFAFYTPQLEGRHQQQTIDRQNKIARILADYALRIGHLPCAAAPDGGTALGTPRSPCTDAGRTGIVPFRELGLTQEDATDGFGNPFTYYVSRMAQDPPGDEVEDSCRRGPWFDAGNPVNPVKAAFCCGLAYGPPLEVYADGTTHVTPIQGDPGSSPADAYNGDVNVEAISLPHHDNFAYFTYVIVSHGKNGFGSYNFGLAARKNVPAAGFIERDNADDDQRYRSLPINKASGNNYFDDIVLWRTQHSMMSEIGDSCAYP